MSNSDTTKKRAAKKAPAKAKRKSGSGRTKGSYSFINVPLGQLNELVVRGPRISVLSANPLLRQPTTTIQSRPQFRFRPTTWEKMMLMRFNAHCRLTCKVNNKLYKTHYEKGQPIS